jgi:hypothetical protein
MEFGRPSNLQGGTLRGQWAKRRPEKAANDYSAKHQQLRKALLPQAYGTACCRCGRPLLPGQEIHLDHDDYDRPKYGGSATQPATLGRQPVRPDANS